MEKTVMVETSARHVHVTEETLEILFGIFMLTLVNTLTNMALELQTISRKKSRMP